MFLHCRRLAAFAGLIVLVACGGSGNHGTPDGGSTVDSGPRLPKCSDGIDNDGDGKIDYPYDPGCAAPNVDDETDDCPSGPNCPQCGNGVDDDLNGLIDYPQDPSCSSAADPDEYFMNPNACGAGLMIKAMPVTGSDMVTFDMASKSAVVSPCGGGGGSLAYAYELRVTQATVIFASTDDPATSADTVLDLRTAMCNDAGAEIACNNDVGTSDHRSTLAQLVAPGVYYLVVEGVNNTVSGGYTLHVSFLEPEGQACTDASQCAPGLVCRVPLSQSAMVCAKPMCNDGVDDDGDGKNDFPDDPGCTSTADNDETDDCPSGPNCPECGNGIDDDNDGATDYPADNTCLSAAGTTESCPSHEPVAMITTPATTGDTSTATDDSKPSCALSSATAPDLMYRLDLPATTTLQLNLTASFDSVTALYDSTCGGAALSCSDPLDMTVDNLAAGTYYFLVDGWSTGSGPFTINVSGTIAHGQSCESPLAQSGALTCGTGDVCGGTMGSRTCVAAACNDGIDNDGDGKADYPHDPGCSSIGDNDETDDCPSGPNCPQCSNGIDDDMNGQTDYPADPSCASASSPIERTCPMEQDGLVTITSGTITDSMVGAHDDHDPSCGGDGGPDRQYLLTIPALQSLTLDTNGTSFDTLLSLMTAVCSEPGLDCNDDGGSGGGTSQIVQTNVAAGTYIVAVDAYSSFTTLGAFNLHVSGVLDAGASCEPADTLGGALTCDATAPCTGTAGSRHCVGNPCNDGIDNDGDGKADYPNDPGCDSPFDQDETDTCPGPGCPACANGLDDDGDTRTDLADPSCWAAAAPSESFCVGETDHTDLIMRPLTTGSTSADHDDFHSESCQGTTGKDATLALVLPVAVDTLHLDTNGSAISDTVLSVHNATCGTEIACDDDGGSSLRSSIDLTGVAAGTYAVIVEGYSSNEGGFLLNVSGTVAPGTACTSPLFATGVLACPSGTTCTGGTCQ